MPEINEKILSSKIKSGQLASPLILWGDEDYLSQKYAERIIKAVTSGGDLNLSVFESDSAKAPDIIAAADTLCMFGRRCVYVNDPLLSSSGLDSDGIKSLCDYFSQKNDSCVLLMRFSKKAVFSDSGFKKLIKAAALYGDTVNFTRYTRQELQKILCLKAAEMGCTMQISSAAYLIDSVGDELSSLINEIEKLSAYKSGGEITPDDISLLCAKSLQARVFDINNAISAGNADKAFSVIDTLMTLHEEPIRILAAISSSYTAMYLMKSAAKDGLSASRVSALCNKKRSEKQLAVSQRECSKYKMTTLAKCIEILTRADSDMKSSQIPQRNILERAVTELIVCTKGKVR